MAYYIKVTRAVADKLNLTGIRNKTADGCVILWQSDLNRYPGTTIFDRAKVLGGIALTAVDAKREIDGCTNPVEPVTPVSFGGTGLTEAEEEALGSGTSGTENESGTGTVQDEGVQAEDVQTGDGGTAEETETEEDGV